MQEKPMIRIVEQISHLPPLYKNVAIYCRVSTKMQEQLHSMSNQASFFVQMVSKRYDWYLVDIYLDFKSGEKQSDRSEFQRMMEDCKNRKIDIILTKSISRFGRNTEETIRAMRQLKECGVKVIFDAENIDTISADNELMITIISAFAQAENDERRKNQYWALKKRLEDSTSEMYTRTCYGYRKGDKGELIIDASEAAVVQKIFQLYLSGNSIIGIIKELEAQQIKSPTGKDKWCKRSIDTILSNEKYIGDAMIFKTYTYERKRIPNKGYHAKYIIEGNHPAIITEEMYEAVQAEKLRRSNTIADENGVRRKSVKYSSKR